VDEQVRVLFSNVLANAVNYSFRNGQVQVACGEQPGGGARVVIRDHGIGIEPDKLPLIFAEYYRTDRAAQHNASSSGLGLAIVRHVAQTHRIHITVESEVDKGTEFRLEFPTLGI
jgi:signal transduction histidine kinase